MFCSLLSTNRQLIKSQFKLSNNVPERERETEKCWKSQLEGIELTVTVIESIVLITHSINWDRFPVWMLINLLNTVVPVAWLILLSLRGLAQIFQRAHRCVQTRINTTPLHTRTPVSSSSRSSYILFSDSFASLGYFLSHDRSAAPAALVCIPVCLRLYSLFVH